MITHFLGPEEVEGYARDLVARLVRLDKFPVKWFALGKSGQIFANLMLDYVPQQLLSSIRIVRVSSNRDTGRVRFHDAIEKTSKPALLIDSAVHTGKSMLAAATKISVAGIKDVLTYSLMIKRNAEIIPNYFGIVIDTTDRCLFQLPVIPNNRLCEEAPFGVLRSLISSDASRRFIKTGSPAIDETSFGALLYEKESKGSHVYVYEHRGAVCGVLSFTAQKNSILIDRVANSIKYRGKGIGAALMRWAETWARSSGYDAIELWAISDRIGFYKKRKFEMSRRKIDLGNATFHLMRRKLLYSSLVDPMDQ